MDYNHIKEYLEKFKIILSSKEENNKIISEIIEKNTGIKIESKFIQIKPPYIYIKASPIIRNEIMINKNKILLNISKLNLKNNFKDIK